MQGQLACHLVDFTLFAFGGRAELPWTFVPQYCGPRALIAIAAICAVAQVVEIRDEAGKLMNDFTGRVKPDERGLPEGFKRTITVAMDTAQYQVRLKCQTV